MSRRYDHEGVWREEHLSEGLDSALYPPSHNPNSRHTRNIHLDLAEIVRSEPEPAFKQHSVAVKLIRGGEIGNVAWPGPNVVVDSGGNATGSNTGIHGLFEAPLPGQQVVVGYIEGETDIPVVLQRYPYNPSQNPVLESAYFLPLTSKLHGPNDIVLGCYIGSYVALRGTLPVPGSIEIQCEGMLNVVSGVSLDVDVAGAATARAATVEIEASGAMNLKASPAVVVNSGTRAVAANGDLTQTQLGPMPVQATGTVLKVV